MYTNELIDVVKKGSDNSTAEDLSSAADHGEDIVLSGCRISRLKFVVTTVTVGDADVTFTRRPTPGSATGEAVIGTLTIPGATAVGSVVYKDVSQKLDPGDAIEFSVSSAGTSGAGYYGYDLSDCPEDPRNLSEMIQSA